MLWPIVTMVQTSFQNITPLGITIGSAGLSNFSQVFKNPNLPGILVRTVIWVAASVAITMVISLGLAQLFNQRFPGRRVARWAIIAPWAASVMMTALIFRWVLEPDNGVVNVFLHQLGLVRFNSNQADWLGRPDSALVWMIGVAVFVSLPFTTYVLLAGLQTIPGELYEAARVDGATSWRAYRRITLPLLRPAFLVAAGHQPDQRVQLVPDHLGDDAGRPGLRDQHHHRLHVRPEGDLRRRVGGDVGRQLRPGRRSSSWSSCG